MSEIPSSSNTVLLPEFSVLHLQGEEALSFLNGQVTCDLNKLEADSYLFGCHCNAKGKLWSAFVCFGNTESLYLIATTESAEKSLQELSKYAVFAKTTVTDVTSDWFIYGATQAYEAKTDEALENKKVISIPFADNHYMIISQQALANSSESNQSWWLNEVLSGRPHLFTNSLDSYVPQMLNLQELDYISFNKGCYMGQETVARMRYLGKNKRALYIAVLDSELSPSQVTDLHSINIADRAYIDLNGNLRSSGKIVQIHNSEQGLAVQ